MEDLSTANRLLGDLVSVDSPGGTGLDLIAVLIYLFEIGLLDMFAVTAGVQEDLVLFVLLRERNRLLFCKGQWERATTREIRSASIALKAKRSQQAASTTQLHFMATKRFQSGKWDGSYMHQGKRNELVLELQFSHDGAVNGTGQDSTGFFSITGVYKPTPPYGATLTRTDMQSGNTMEMSGFRESASGGIFGTWNGTLGSGDFRIKPSADIAAMEKKLKEEAEKKKVEQLKAMGFPEEWAKDALKETKGDLDAAVEHLTLQLSAGDDFGSTPTASGGGGGGDVADASLVSQLTDMGFSADQAKMALQACDNDVGRAVEFLFNQ